MANKAHNSWPKAYELLAVQPVSSKGLDEKARSEIVLSAVSDGRGGEHIVSRFGDAVWNLSPWFEQSNASDSAKIISWPSDLPQDLVSDCKAALYAWFKKVLPNSKPPVARGIHQAAIGSAIPLMRWLRDKRVVRFDQVRPIHIANYVHETKQFDGHSKYAYDRLRVLDLLWVFRSDTTFEMKCNPCGGKSLWQISGLKKQEGADAVGKTPIIPPDVQTKVFAYCEKVLSEAGLLLANLESGKISLSNTELLHVRDCALYVISITSGMRNEEVIGIESGAWRREVKDGVEYCWVATTEHKTGKGKVEFLIPALTMDVLEVMRKYAKPFQERLATEISVLQGKGETIPSSKALLRIAKGQKDLKKIFLCLVPLSIDGPAKRGVDAMNYGACKSAFMRLAIAAKVEWELRPHQCRRTYARCIVESRMGRSSLVFLKWQFKHSSMSMTQLYASNPMQDAAIYDEVLQEMLDFKVDLIESWMGDQPLSGGAGRAISKMRAIPISNRAEPVAKTAAEVHIPATGHGWCLAQEKGCGGAGLYEATRCVDCKNGVIDESFANVWKGIHSQQLELLDIDDVGLAVKQRAERDIKWALQVIADLRLPNSTQCGSEERGIHSESKN